jgi:hypothetical protein
MDTFQDYVIHGWKLCAIDRGFKEPTYPKWNIRPIDEQVATVIEGAGLLHALSGTCALDIDDLDKARDWLAERGVDLDALLADRKAVKITSGRKGRAKLLYRLKTPMPTFKPPGSGVEFRCATKKGTSAQDVLPPSIHPDTKKPYAWEYGTPLIGDWALLPPIPATLLAAWRTLIAEEPKANGHATKPLDIALESIYEWIENKDPNMEYPDWLKVGMKLHDATEGAEEGLEIWKQWSSKATRKLSKPANFRSHWESFSSTPGKHVASLEGEMPAGADEFEVITPEPAAKSEESKPEAEDVKAAREAQKTAKQNAIQALEARVVYVLASEKYFDCQRHALIGSDSALEHQFTHLMPKIKGVRLNPVKILKQSITKKLVDGLGFHPGEGALFTVRGDTFANTYRNRLPKPLAPTHEEIDKIEWVFGRIEDDAYRQWIKQYYGHVVQRPAVKVKTAPLIWSEIERNGKSTILKHIPKLLVGPEFSKDVSYDLLNSNFNDYLQSAWHVNLTEFRAGTRGERTMIHNKLKAYIADDEIALHPKGGTGYTMPNHFFVTASSNEEDAAAINNNDRRWGIYEMKSPEYTEAERQWIYHEFLLKPRAAAVLRHYFMHVDLTGFHAAGSPPMTEAKASMVNSSRAIEQEMLESMFEEHAEFFAKDAVLVREVTSYIHKNSFVRPNEGRIGKILAKPPFNGMVKRIRAGKGLYKVCIVRNHMKWDAAPGHEVYAHITGDDDVIDIMA